MTTGHDYDVAQTRKYKNDMAYAKFTSHCLLFWFECRRCFAQLLSLMTTFKTWTWPPATHISTQVVAKF